MTDKTLWEKDIDNAEQANAKLGFYEDVRFLTGLVSELWDIVEKKCPGEIDEQFNAHLWWYFATETVEEETSESVNPPVNNASKCKCDTKTLFNFGCQCGGGINA